MTSYPIFSISLLMMCVTPALAAEAPPPKPGDRMLAEYFRSEVATISSTSLADVRSLDNWLSRREEYRRQLAEMLGLWPMPQRTDLNPVITGRTDHPQFVVEKLHFQSRPGLYVTANLYIPKGLTQPAPAILYVCGHSNFKKDGISFGSKVPYQHHPAWFARNGYVCLILDTLQLGEIEGIHHGTYREKMWWWHSRGYTPAGVEAWNGIRALDYLQSRPEVDPNRIGMTGRSGGGASTWWVAALDDRIQCAVPVAGITDLQNHVVDGCIEGHCDCMYMVNTYRWDFAQVAALLVPRPLLIANTDKDSIFPLDGVVRLHTQVRRIYRLHNADDKLGLLITEGPHKDTQDLQVPTFRWFDRFLKNENSTIETLATRFFEPEQLRVFTELPTDQINTHIHDEFVPMAGDPPLPASAKAWRTQRDAWLDALRSHCFRGWPDSPPPLNLTRVFTDKQKDIRFEIYEFSSQQNVPLRLFLLQNNSQTPRERIVLHVLDESDWADWRATVGRSFPVDFVGPDTSPTADAAPSVASPTPTTLGSSIAVYLAPRGIGPTAWTGDERRQTHIRRRFALIGQSLDGMRVWDICRAIQAIRSINSLENTPLHIRAQERMAILAVYASLFEPRVAALELSAPPASHRQGPELLNVLRILDVPTAIALAAERSRITIENMTLQAWAYPLSVQQKLNWPTDQLIVKSAPPD